MNKFKQLFRLGIEKRPWDGGAYQPYALALKERGEMALAMEVRMCCVCVCLVCGCVWTYVYVKEWRVNTHIHPARSPPKPHQNDNHPIKQVFQKGLQEDPYHCPLYQAFGMLLADLGRVDAAR